MTIKQHIDLLTLEELEVYGDIMRADQPTEVKKLIALIYLNTLNVAPYIAVNVIKESIEKNYLVRC